MATNTPLTFTAVEANSTIKLNAVGSPTAISLEFSTDGSTWQAFNVGTTYTLANVGDSMLLRGDNTRMSSTETDYHKFVMTGKIAASGNVMSLLDKTSALLDLTGRGQGFEYLFDGCSSLTTAPELPATTLADYCYRWMFRNCTSLTTAPELTAATAAIQCYYFMFSGCTSLTAAPELPATTLASNCYASMFQSCRALTAAPVLSATTLAGNCYKQMFLGCTSLTAAPELPATTLANACYYAMFNGCTSLTTAPELPATTLADTCYFQMFYNCSSLTSAPELLATTLKPDCYRQMFEKCTSLTDVPFLPATTLASSCYRYMFEDCSSLSKIEAAVGSDQLVSSKSEGWLNRVAETGTFYYTDPNFDTSITRSDTTVPEGWAVKNYCLTFTALDAGANVTFNSNGSVSVDYSIDGQTWSAYTSGTAITLANVGDYVMFKGDNNTTNGCTFRFSSGRVAASGSVISLIDSTNKLRDLTGRTYCFAGLFQGINNCLVQAPELPATTLSPWCYSGMFTGCYSLTAAPELPATALANYCYYSMFNYCSSLATAPELPATTLANSCYASMFSGCTSLSSAPELPATTLANECYCSMFYRCRSLTAAPELPATTLAEDCYWDMFNGCSSLNYVKCAITREQMMSGWVSEKETYTQNWLYDVAPTGTYEPIDIEYLWGVPRSASTIPEGWRVGKPQPSLGRFFIDGKEVSELFIDGHEVEIADAPQPRPFPTDRLVAHFDAIDNTLSGHSNTTTQWDNLVEGQTMKALVRGTSSPNFESNAAVFKAQSTDEVFYAKDAENTDVSLSSVVNPGGEMTFHISWYYNTATVRNYCGLIGKEGNYGCKNLYIPLDSRIQGVRMSTAEWQSEIQIDISDALVPNAFNTITVVVTNPTFKVYVNGTYVGQQTADADLYIEMPFCVGGGMQSNQTSRVLIGKVHDIFVYDKALAEDGITQLHNYSTTRFNT